MTKIHQLVIRLLHDRKGQDMVEYALLAGFIAVAAGTILPNVEEQLSIVFSRMQSVVTDAAS